METAKLKITVEASNINTSMKNFVDTSVELLNEELKSFDYLPEDKQKEWLDKQKEKLSMIKLLNKIAEKCNVKKGE